MAIANNSKYRKEVFDAVCRKGKKCGEICIPKKSKCRDGEQKLSQPESSKSNNFGRTALITAAATGGGTALVAAGTLGAIAGIQKVKQDYIKGFAESGKIALKESEKIKAPKLPDNIKTAVFAVGGFGTKDAFSESVLLEENIKSLGIKNLYSEPIEYKDFNVANNPAKDGAAKAATEALNLFLKTTTQKKYNPVARQLAAKLLAYKKANPNVDFQLIGHSGGGLTVQETNEILHTLGVKAKTTAIGSPDVDIIPGNGDIVTAASDKDYIVNRAGGGKAVNRKSFNKVAEHGQDAYFEDADFRKFVKDRLATPVRQDRMDKANCKVGKECGDICIPKKSVCREGQSASLKTPDGKVALGATGAIAAGLGVSTGTIMIAKERYRRNLPESVNMAREKADEIDLKTLKNFDDKEQITLFQTGFTGAGGNVRRIANEQNAERIVKQMLPSHGVVVRENKDFNIPQVFADPDANLKPGDPGFYGTVTIKSSTQFLGNAIKKTASTFFATGRNPEAINLAAEAYAYHKKYPKKPINIIGHSAGGIIAPEAANILKEMKVPTKVVNIGGPDFGVIDYPDYKAFASRKDPITGIFPSPKATYVNEVGNHNYESYLTNPQIRKEVLDFFEIKPKNDSYIEGRDLILKKSLSGVGRFDAANSSKDLVIKQFSILLSRACNKQIGKIVNIKSSPNGEITGLFTLENKPFKFTFKDGNLTYQSTTKRSDSIYIYYDAVPKKGILKSKRKRCKVGISCGSTCIEKDNVCKLKTSELAKPSELLQLNQAIARFKLEENTQQINPEPKKEEDYIINPETGNNYTIRELRKVASSKGVVGYGSMPIDEMRSAIKLADRNPESAQRIVSGVARKRSLGTRAIAVSGLSGRNKNEREAKRQLKDIVTTNKRLEALIKFSGSAPIAWTAGAVGAFLLGTTIRTYEQTKGKYREGFDESAKLAEERAVKLRLVHVPQDNITFAVGSGKGHGAEEIKKLLQREEPDNDGDYWLTQNNYVIPFDLQETGINKKSNETGNGDEILDGMKNYLQTFKRGKNQDAIDLAAHLYAYGIQRKASNPSELKNKYKKINVVAHGMAGQTTKEALELLSRMDIKGNPTGKEVLRQVNVVNLGTPHFGFAENQSRRHRTIISSQDPVSNIPNIGSGARQQWISTVKGHSAKDYLEDNRVRDAIRESFGYYEGSLEELGRKEKKRVAFNARRKAATKETAKVTSPTPPKTPKKSPTKKPPARKPRTNKTKPPSEPKTDAYEIQRVSTLNSIFKVDSEVKLDFLNQCSGGNKRCGDICLPPEKKCRLNYSSNPKEYNRQRLLSKLGRGTLSSTLGGLGQDLERAYLRTRDLIDRIKNKDKPTTRRQKLKKAIVGEAKLIGVQLGQGTISKKLKEADKSLIDFQEEVDIISNQLKEKTGTEKEKIRNFVQSRVKK